MSRHSSGQPRNTTTRTNIRATPDPAFWGNGYDKSVYLWPGANDGLTLDAIVTGDVPTLADPFDSREALKEADSFSRRKYSLYVPLLAKKLNELHQMEMPHTFWQTAWGWWLYRHICAVYDKYTRLRTLDLDNTSIKLLSPHSFYIPNDHNDYWRCFCNAHGVLQLVSDYYSLFGTKHHDVIEKDYMDDRGGTAPDPTTDVTPLQTAEYMRVRGNLRQVLRSASPKWLRTSLRWLSGNRAPRIALCGAFYSQAVLGEVTRRSHGEIGGIQLPRVAVHERPVDRAGRMALSRFDPQDAFDTFFMRTLLHSLPRILVEYFRDYYQAYRDDLQTSRITHIVSEAWISYMPLSIYCAIARQEHRVKLVMQQHGASQQWLLGCLDWITIDVSDTYITTGWQSDSSKAVRGGFAAVDVVPYQFERRKTDIVHVCTTRYRYSFEYVGMSPGARFLRYLKRIDALLESLPSCLREHYVLRPRRIPGVWDTEQLLDVSRRRGIRVDPEGSLSRVLTGARIVIVDHLSTAVAEILQMGVPCLILHDDEVESLADEYGTILEELKACGVVQSSAASLVEHLSRIYEDVEVWWRRKEVQEAIEAIVAKSLGPPTRTVELLLSLSSEEAGRCREERQEEVAGGVHSEGVGAGGRGCLRQR